MPEIDKVTPGGAIPPKPRRQPHEEPPHRPAEPHEEPAEDDDEQEDGIDVYV